MTAGPARFLQQKEEGDHRRPAVFKTPVFSYLKGHSPIQGKPVGCYGLFFRNLCGWYPTSLQHHVVSSFME